MKKLTKDALKQHIHFILQEGKHLRLTDLGWWPCTDEQDIWLDEREPIFVALSLNSTMVEDIKAAEAFDVFVVEGLTHNSMKSMSLLEEVVNGKPVLEVMRITPTLATHVLTLLLTENPEGVFTRWEYDGRQTPAAERWGLVNWVRPLASNGHRGWVVSTLGKLWAEEYKKANG